jgi:hypothetical protein
MLLCPEIWCVAVGMNLLAHHLNSLHLLLFFQPCLKFRKAGPLQIIAIVDVKGKRATDCMCRVCLHVKLIWNLKWWCQCICKVEVWWWQTRRGFWHVWG